MSLTIAMGAEVTEMITPLEVIGMINDSEIE